MSAATGLDHVGVAIPDLDRAAAEWQALGFAPQPLAVHLNDGRPTGTGNRNIMLRQGYVELLATIDPARPSATLGRFLARHQGIHVLTLAVADAESACARLHRAGFPAAAVARSSRPADPSAPAGPPAAFARIPLADADPRLQLIEQLTPDLVWQERFLHHPNRARALTGVVVAATDPAGFAARLARVAGRPLAPDPAGGLVLALPDGGRVRVLAPAVAASVLPGGGFTPPVHILGLEVATDDANQAVARLLPGATAVGDRLLARAGGVAVVFAP